MTPLRRGVWLGVCALALVGSGCDLLAMPYFLFGPEPSVDAKLKRLASDDKDEKIKVAVLVANNLEVREQLARVDRELSGLVVKHLSELCTYNKENVHVLPVNAVERYKASHPDWDHPLDLTRIGKDLKVRYVVYLQINALSLYEPKSSDQFYHGQTDINVTLVDVRKPPDDLPEEDHLHDVYPTNPESTFDDPNPIAFRHRFLDHVAQKIAWDFTSHPTKRDYMAE